MPREWSLLDKESRVSASLAASMEWHSEHLLLIAADPALRVSLWGLLRLNA